MAEFCFSCQDGWHQFRYCRIRLRHLHRDAFKNPNQRSSAAMRSDIAKTRNSHSHYKGKSLLASEAQTLSITPQWPHSLFCLDLPLLN